MFTFMYQNPKPLKKKEFEIGQRVWVLCPNLEEKLVALDFEVAYLGKDSFIHSSFQDSVFPIISYKDCYLTLEEVCGEVQKMCPNHNVTFKDPGSKQGVEVVFNIQPMIK